jgi:DNA polymerase (family 10)
MDNRLVSSIFEKIADILEIKGENVFRIRAYRTAARNIRGLGRQLSDILREDPEALLDIPGIGRDLADKITEMVETGHLAYYSELMKGFPAGMLDMMDLEGLGPKKVKKLHDELGIDGIDELEKACGEGRISGLEGMGARTEEKILSSIGHFREQHGRMLLPEAWDLADELVSALKSCRGAGRVEKAGSLRRGRETVGDIDILATGDDTPAILSGFTAHPLVEEVLSRGETRSSVKLHNGVNVDLRIVAPDCFGAALIYFTGSMGHNVRLRGIAGRKGLKLNEYGVFRASGGAGEGEKVAGRTEKDVYAALGMQFVPPELRESRGEVEAAMQGSVPRDLVTEKDLRGDLHLHTDRTDGKVSPRELIEEAIRSGYEYIAVTDHSRLVRIAGGLDGGELMEHAAFLKKLDSEYPEITVLTGVEVDILADGSLDLDDSVLRELDVVIAAVHSRFSFSRQEQTERVLRALDNKYVNALAHPSGRLITRRKPLDLDTDRVFRKAAERNIAMEINTHGERIDLNDVNASRARELGCRFIISTDAHGLEQMKLMRYGVMTARRAWLRKKDVLNTFTLRELRKALVRP